MHEHGARRREPSRGERCPRNEADILVRAIVEHVLALAVDEIVLILDGNDGEELFGRLDRLDIHFGKSDMADQAFLLHFGDHTELLLARHRRIDPVQLPEIDPLYPEPAEAHQHALAQIVRPPDHAPDVRPMPRQRALGRDHEALVGRKHLGDQVLADIGPVAVGGIDQVDPEFRHALQHPLPLLDILRRPPDAGTGDAHGAEAEARDRHVAEGEGSGRGGRRR